MSNLVLRCNRDSFHCIFFPSFFVDWQRKHKGRSLADSALSPNFTTVRLNDVQSHSESDPCAPSALIPMHRTLIKSFKYPLHIFRWNPYPGIANSDFHPAFPLLPLLLQSSRYPEIPSL